MFRHRFLIVTVILPIAISLAAAMSLIAQLLQLDRPEWLRVLVIWIVCYASVSILFARRLYAAALTVEHARTSDQLSEALSACLGTASNGSNSAWTGSGVAFVLLATGLVERSVHGLTAFGVAALLTGVLAVAFVYASAKRMVAREAQRLTGVFYTGREIGVARKIGVIFIGVFVASTASLVALVSARVSLSLERLAISSAERDFASSLGIARTSKGLADEELQRLDMYLASKYVFFRIGPDGQVTSSQPRSGESLTSDEVRRVRAMREGDSASFVAPHVLRFAPLPDGSILTMRIPWHDFARLPRQIVLYALVVFASTVVVFSGATYFLANDLTAPLRQVRRLSLDLSEGNFGTSASIFTDDEISSVARGVITTRENLRSLLGEVGGSGSSIADRVRTLSEGSESLLHAARQQSTVTNTSSEALANVRRTAESVLATTGTVAERARQTSTEAGQLAASADAIASGMEAVFTSVEHISRTSAGIGLAAEEMSERTGWLATASEEIVTSAAELVVTIGELRRAAATTTGLSREVDANAAAGAGAVARTVEGIEMARNATAAAAGVMHQLGRSTKEIEHILSIIEEVASRTNLLSLNAAIIAAQAGARGAGFQVVAEEIRTLADETRQSTKDITTIVRTIQTESRGAMAAIEDGVQAVEQSVTLAHEAAGSLDMIQRSAAASMEMSEQTTRALDEQARAATRLQEVVARFSDHVQEISRGARDHAQASVLLSGATDQVRAVANDVNRSTRQQSAAAAGITAAMAVVADDLRRIHDELAAQLAETRRIADASDQILRIARKNDEIASDFGASIGDLLATAGDFEHAVLRFRL